MKGVSVQSLSGVLSVPFCVKPACEMVCGNGRGSSDDSAAYVNVFTWSNAMSYG